MNEVIRLYQSGMFQREIAEKFGVTQGTISIRLQGAGVKMRSRTEADKLAWMRKTPKQREMTYEAAHIAARNRKRCRAEKEQRAILNQSNPKLSSIEQKFLEAFKDANMVVTPQFALSIYNIDFAVPERKVAIEIDGGNWHSSKTKRKQDTGKEVLLRNRGWKLVRFQVYEHRLKIVSDVPTHDFADVINVVCSHPTLFG
jgi:very-short-patch-repair endonuclease